MSTWFRTREMDEEQKLTCEDNARLIEWAVAIYGIFWGIWLASFTENVVTSCEWPVLIEDIVVDHLLVGRILCLAPIGFLVMITTYTFFLLKWLWGLRFVLPGAGFQAIFKNARQAAILWSYVTLFILGFQYLCSISIGWASMGIWATLGLHATTAAVVLVERRAW